MNIIYSLIKEYMLKAKSRLAHNKNKRRYKNLRGNNYYYDPKDRVKIALGLVGSMVFMIFLMGYRQITDMINTWQDLPVQVQAREIIIVPEPTPTPKPQTEKEQILAYIVEVFGEDSADAITIINKCENKAFNPKATNWNRNGTWDTGIFQINQIHGYTMEEMQDWKQNIDAAKKIFDNSTWSAWSCSRVVNIKSFWQ